MMSTETEQRAPETRDDAYEFYKIVHQLVDPARERGLVEQAVLLVGAAALGALALWALDAAAVSIWRALTCPC